MDPRKLLKPCAAPLVVVACCALAGPVLADDDDIFLLDAVAPNVVILLDTSGSMNDTIDGKTKMSTAKEVVTGLIASVPGVNFGVFGFNHDSTGGAIVGHIGMNTSTLIDRVNDISAVGWTPLGRALADVQDYYLGVFSAPHGTSEGEKYWAGHGRGGWTPGCQDSGGPDENGDENGDDPCDNPDAEPEDYWTPIQFECQPNYVIVVTDGLPNGEDTYLVADVATSLFTSDHSALPGTQNVITYTVGFDVPAGTTLLTQTAENGGGQFYTATNAASLQAALQDALSQILDASYSFAAPTFPSTSATDSSRAFIASFEPNSVSPFWEGHLRAYNRQSDGRVPVDSNSVPLDSAIAWDAGELLAARTASSRTIYTVVGGNRQAFTTANSTITKELLGVSTSTLRSQVINFIRGTDAFDADGDSNTTEQRPWKLGDIFHSAPVMVFPPPLHSTDESYNEFKEANAARTSILLVGANDGMLHAFSASTGVELWGFIPPDLLGELRHLGNTVGTHRYYVDSTPVVADVQISGAWKTVAMFGTRRGGRTYHALDITDTTDPKYLWSFTSSRMGETWSVPTIGKVRLDGDVSKTVAFVGGGYDTPNNNATGKAFFVLDLATGAKLWEYYNTGSNDASKMNFSLAASPSAVDVDRDGYIDYVYAADVGGQLWKFDVSAPGTLSSGVVTNWSGRRLFAADSSQSNPPSAGTYHPDQAIYGAPAVAFDSLGQLWIFFGTGDRNRPNSGSDNRFYGLIDDGAMTNNTAVTEASLADVTSSGEPTAAGWYLTLWDDEKVLDGAEVFARTVFFSTYTPATTGECQQESGTARLYAVDMLGASPDFWDDPDDDDSRSRTVGEGIPSKPEVVAGGASPLLVVGTTNEELTMDPLTLEGSFELRYWREVY